ncbi:alpha-amylase [Algoriphagus persicinus]|uniref:alpha-amylase n=1 Tax=Algoriphagus persicinus TaxID=3108754 RepID=UPI002B372950|nr:alpha-amylase [Algoriphagus sp. E1-3-M2]MEB2785248.1 alpha-amylase [Algoriphagus sp. E1-3-M2]
MKTICLYFQIHQPFRLKNFPFYEIGKGKPYFDEEVNSSILKVEAHNIYLPINRLLLKLILSFEKKLNLSFSISGTALDQLENYAPEVIDSFQKLYDTGCVEFIGDTYAHSLAAHKSQREFSRQVKAHSKKINELFGACPTTFQISHLSYTDSIGKILYDIGFDTVVLDGIDELKDNGLVHRVYRNDTNPDLKLLLSNQQLHDDISTGYSNITCGEFTLTPENYADWLRIVPQEQRLINLFMNYMTLGNLHNNGRNVFEFLEKFVEQSLSSGIQLSKPSQLPTLDTEVPLSTSSLPFKSGDHSWNNMKSRLGNELQKEAFNALYDLESQIVVWAESPLKQDWLYLQSSDHFYYMCTDHVDSEETSPYLSPYGSPFFAYINFMNIVTDLHKRAKYLNQNLVPVLVM